MDGDRIRIRIEDDGLSALVSVVTGAVAEAGELARALEAAGIHHGIETSIIDETAAALANPDFACRDRVIARGTPSEPGRDGELWLDFQVGLEPGTEREDESLDFLERQKLKPAVTGQQIAQISAPTEGVAGVDVRGETFPAVPGKPVTLSLLEGVESDDGGKVIATTGGVILYQPGKSIDVVTHANMSATSTCTPATSTWRGVSLSPAR